MEPNSGVTVSPGIVFTKINFNLKFFCFGLAYSSIKPKIGLILVLLFKKMFPIYRTKNTLKYNISKIPTNNTEILIPKLSKIHNTKIIEYFF